MGYGKQQTPSLRRVIRRSEDFHELAENLPNFLFPAQVAGWGSMRRTGGRYMMAESLEQVFDTARGMVGR